MQPALETEAPPVPKHVERTLVALQHNPQTVALVAMGPSIMDYMEETLTQEFRVGFADEVWAINMAANMVRHDVVFWMDDLLDQFKFKPLLIQALARYGTPVITSIRRPEIVPNSFDYPISSVAKFATPIFGKPYLNNGVAMGIAYAIHKNVKTLKIYGADFSYPNRDYAESGRACVEVWIAIACSKGVNVQLSKRTSLLDTVKDHGIYGYKDQPSVYLDNGVVAKYEQFEGVGKYMLHSEANPVQPPSFAKAPAGYAPEDSSGMMKGKPNGIDQAPASLP